jgi:hypothetical protein
MFFLHGEVFFAGSSGKLNHRIAERRRNWIVGFCADSGRDWYRVHAEPAGHQWQRCVYVPFQHRL